MDTNDDGIGDLRGIIDKLDYLKDLGVNILWLCPIFASPNADNGYDISDYHAIAPEFGSTKDFDELLQSAHQKGLRVLLDLVVNHTSDEHEWFKESRSSVNNPKRDYYIWHKGKNGVEPNNWASFFTGSAWEKDETTGEYYLHLFSKKQPDLNWENPLVRNEIFSMMKFWLDKRIDGFRMDVINFLSKAPGWPDAPKAAHSTDKDFIFHGPIYANNKNMHDILKEMHREVLSKYDIMTVGECHFISPQTGLLYVEEDRNELDMLFHFDTLVARRDIIKLKRSVSEWYRIFKGKAWQTVSLSNHDSPRHLSAFGDDVEFRVQSAKLLATFILTAPGTPFLYQGEEFGMTNVAFSSIEDYRDVETLSRYSEARAKGKTDSEALRELQPLSRDNARTPMQWDNSQNSGFTKGEPWIKVNPNYLDVNLANEMNNPDSIYNFYRDLINYRKDHSAFIYGDYFSIEETLPAVYAYTRKYGDEQYLIVLNFSSINQSFQVPSNLVNTDKKVVFTNYKGSPDLSKARLVLQPWEAWVVEVY